MRVTIHRANADFWNDYRDLPEDVRARANPQHPSLQFKKIGERRGEEIWSARVTLKYRALAVRLADEYIWFWIGEHNVHGAIIS
jgi:hypothetical protein